MLQAFVVVLREAFEAFIIIAITVTYLKKTGRPTLLPAVWWGLAASVLISAGLGFVLLNTASGPLWEGWMALISAVLIAFFVVHMWRTAGTLKKDMEKQLSQKISLSTSKAAFLGVFAFTVIMVAREGMETALLLIQIHEGYVVRGAILGLAVATGIAFLWLKASHLINLKLFFQVTSVFLLLFVGQVLMYSFHEFTEAGVFPNSEALHIATEPYSPDGVYGKWVSVGMVAFCGAWLCLAVIKDRFRLKTPKHSN